MHALKANVIPFLAAKFWNVLERTSSKSLKLPQGLHPQLQVLLSLCIINCILSTYPSTYLLSQLGIRQGFIGANSGLGTLQPTVHHGRQGNCGIDTAYANTDGRAKASYTEATGCNC